MVFRFISCAFAIASISFSVSLRDRDQELSELTSDTGLVGILSRAVEQAHASEEHRLQLLEEAASVLGRLHSTNRSAELSDDAKKKFRGVLKLIAESIFDSVNKSHADTLEKLERSVDPVKDCDEQKDYRIENVNGDIYQDEHHWHKFREKHWSCRREETQAYALNDSTWGDFRHYFHNLVRMHKWHFPEPRSIYTLNDYFMQTGPIWVKRYYENQAEYKRLRQIWVAARDALDVKTQECFMNLTAMNMQYCSYQLGLRDCCIGYKRCRKREVENYYTINATAHRAAKSRKKIWKHGVFIIEHVKCLIGDGCKEVPTDDTHYDVEAPDLTDKTVCSIAPVEAEVCTDSFVKFLNLTGTYENKQLASCQADDCPECIVIPPVNRSKDNCTDSHANYTNSFESNCVFYDDHQRACGRSEYDGTGGFDSRSMCCVCGGGDPPL